jgi:hypothetical protein
MLTSAFQALGKSVSLLTNAAASTTQSAVIFLTDLGLLQAPQSLRIVNNGTVDIWVSFTPLTQAAAFPTPGTVTAGTPQPGFRLKPGVVEVFALNAMSPNPAVAQIGNPGFWVNTISTVAAQPFDITPGEGL